MRWMKKLTCYTLMLTSIAGCARQVYLPESVAQNHMVDGHLPTPQEMGPSYFTDPQHPENIPFDFVETSTHPDKPIRYLSLAEAIATAVEHGAEGTPDLTTGANTSDILTLASFEGPGVSSTFQDDSVRAFSLDPAIIGAAIESSLSRFDARLVSSMTWTTTDTPVATAAQTFEAAGTTSVIHDQSAAFSGAILKPLASGGVAGITFNTNYDFSNLPTAVKPSYTPLLQFSFEQPLLRGFGTEINQLSPTFPGSILNPNLQVNPLNSSEGIVITRLRFDQQRAEFERHMHNLLISVETAYWNLYGQYWTLYSQEAALTQAWVAWRITKAKTIAGQQTEADLKQAQSQYETFRSSRLQALSGVIERERILRDLLGMPVADGCRLVPSDSPTLAEYRPDWCSALQQAQALRPELVIAREDLKWRQLNLMVANNQFLPDLRVTSTYGITGIGTTLAGGPDSAFANLASNHFDDWSIGLVLNVPLGRRDSEAGIRIARLQVARTLYAVEDQERKAGNYLAQQYRNVIDSYKQIGINRSNREALSAQVIARYQQFNAGKTTLDILLEAQRNWAAAIQTEYAAIVNYNNALALFEFAKGTIMQHDNVTIAEGALPCGVAKRAAEHERERNAGIVLKERSRAVPHPENNGNCADPALPQLPDDSAASLPSLLENSPKVGKDVPDGLPAGNAAGLPPQTPALLTVPTSVERQQPEMSSAPLSEKQQPALGSVSSPDSKPSMTLEIKQPQPVDFNQRTTSGPTVPTNVPVNDPALVPLPIPNGK